MVKFVNIKRNESYNTWLNKVLQKLHMSKYERLINNMTHISKTSIAEELYLVGIHLSKAQKQVEKEKKAEEEWAKIVKGGIEEERRQFMRKVINGYTDTSDDDDADDEESDGFDLIQ